MYGAAAGASVGSTVGASDGSTVGASDGSTDGASVGTGPSYFELENTTDVIVTEAGVSSESTFASLLKKRILLT